MIKGVTGNGAALSGHQLDLGLNDGVCGCVGCVYVIQREVSQFGHSSKGVLLKIWYLAREVIELVLRFEAMWLWE